MFTLIIPANADVFFSELFDMIAFDPIDVQDFLEAMFSIGEDTQEISDALSDINEKLEDLGYESAYFLTNIGSLILVVFLQLLLIPLSLAVWKLRFCKPSIKKRAKKQVKGCFFNGILTFIDGTLVVILIMGLINTKMVSQGNIEADSSYFFSVLFLIACAAEMILFPIFVLVRFRQGTLDDKKNKKRCGYAYEELNYKIRGGTTLLYPVMY